MLSSDTNPFGQVFGLTVTILGGLVAFVLGCGGNDGDNVFDEEAGTVHIVEFIDVSFIIQDETETPVSGVTVNLTVDGAAIVEQEVTPPLITDAGGIVRFNQPLAVPGFAISRAVAEGQYALDVTLVIPGNEDPTEESFIALGVVTAEEDLVRRYTIFDIIEIEVQLDDEEGGDDGGGGPDGPGPL